MLAIAMRGLPGSGKSTVAREVSRRLRVPLVDKDDVKDLIDGHVPDSGWHAYKVWLRLIDRQLQQGLSVVCDSPLPSVELYEQLVEMSRESGAQLVIVHCECQDDRIFRERIEARESMSLPAHHQTEWSRFCGYRAHYLESASYPVEVPLLKVSTLVDLSDTADEVVDWLRLQDPSTTII